jgi:hypothetical protein
MSLRIAISSLSLLLFGAVAIAQSPESVSTGKSYTTQSATPVVLHEGDSVTLPESTTVQAPRSEPGFWSFTDGQDRAPLRTNSQAFRDKGWAVTQSVWLGAIVYDVELTHAGIAHHRCSEANGDYPHPSRASLYLGSIPEYAVGTGFNYLMMRFVGKPMIFVVSGWGTVQHIRGGSAWLTNCW